MNNLAKLMEMHKITPLELAARSGVAVSNIRYIMKDPEATPQRKTAERLANALNTTPAQICAVTRPGLNDKELLTHRLCDAAENAVRALRDYTNGHGVLCLVVHSRIIDGTNTYHINAQTLDDGEILAKSATLEFDTSGELTFAKYSDERRPK